MKSKLLPNGLIVAMLCASSNVMAEAPPTLKMTSVIPSSVMAPDKDHSSIGTLHYFDGVPTKETVQMTYDYLDRSRAVNVYLNSLPSLSAYAIKQGQKASGCAETAQICIYDNLMDSKSLILTGNTSTMYAMGWIDLAKDGPTVIELPTGMLGVLDDMAFRFMTDLGVAGPDKGEGGKYLILPPNYTGDIPEGYFVVRSETNGVWLFMRGYLTDGIEAASKNIRENLSFYPLAQAGNKPEMTFTNVSGVTENTIVPNNVNAFSQLHALIQEEPDSFLGKEAKGMMAAIGIEKGKPFAPDDRMKVILDDAAKLGNVAARSISYYPRDPGNMTYGDSSAWVRPYAYGDTRFTTSEGAYRLDARVLFHFGYIVVSPAMAVKVPGKGSDYSIAMLDNNKNALDGTKTYKLHLPANVPVKDFWAVTMYDTQTRSQLQTDQQFPTLGSQDQGLKQNEDGSYDIYFSPTPPAGKEGNWLQTIPNKSWFIALRIYGPLQAWIEQEWRPGEIELLD